MGKGSLALTMLYMSNFKPQCTLQISGSSGRIPSTHSPLHNYKLVLLACCSCCYCCCCYCCCCCNFHIVVVVPHLYLLVPEGEEEPFAVLGPEPVNAPGVDGPGQVVVDLLLRVLLVLLPTRSYTQPNTQNSWSTVGQIL